MSILTISKNNKNLIEIDDHKNYQREQFKFKDIKIELLNDRIFYQNENLIGYNEDKSIYAFIIGEIYDLKVDKLKEVGHKFSAELDSEYIVHLYEEYGEDALKKLNGKFVICLVDTLNEDIIIANDRYGSINFYYNIENDNFIFTNHSNTILSNVKDKTIDEESVQNFSNYGCVIGNKTLLKNVKRMDSASIIKINNDNIIIDRYWDWNIKKLESTTFDEAVNRLGELWIEAVRKIVSKHDKFNITITGGLDSRAVVAAIDYLNLNHKINLAYTIGLKGCLDGQIAKKVSERAGLNYKFFEIDDKQYLANAFKALDRTICTLNTNYACISILHEEDIFKFPILSGTFGGETIGGDLLLDKSKYKNEEEIISQIYNNQAEIYGIGDKELILNQSDLNKNNDNRKYSSNDFYILDKFLIRNRTAVLFEMMGDNYNNLSPFLDNNFFDYLYSLPEEWREKRYIYSRMILKFFPKFYIDIPWSNSKLPIYLNLSEDEIDAYSKGLKYELNVKNKDIVIFGASMLGKKVYNLLKNHYNIIYYCDNDWKKWGSVLNGIKIISPQELVKMDNISVVVGSMYYKEILKQLGDLEIKDYIFIGIEEGEVKSYTDFGKWLKNKYVYDSIKNKVLNNKVLYNHVNVNYFVEKMDKHISCDEGRYEDLLLINSLSRVIENICK